VALTLPTIPTDGSPVTISELSIPFRTMLFAGKDTPEQPVVVAAEQRAQQTHYPGTHKASVQFMGSKRDDIVLRGWFQDPISVIDGGPAAREALLRSMMQGGRLCQLIWGTRIICQGRVFRVHFEHHLSFRTRYEITFAVDQGNEFDELAPPLIGVAVAAEVAAALRDAVDAANLAVNTVRTAKVLTGVVR
jgi:hypothetical protein